MSIFGITENGISIPRLADFKTEMQRRFEVEADEVGNIDWDGASRPLGMAFGIFAAMLSDCAQALQLAFTTNDLNSAYGMFLENIGSYSLTARKRETKSRVIITLGGTAGTVVTNAEVRDAAGNDWASVGSATIPGDLEFAAKVPGRILAPPGTVTEIRTPITGWATATNAAAAIPGLNRQNDPEYRQSIVAGLAKNGANSLLSVRANLLDIVDVQAVAAIDNPEPDPAVVNGIALPKNSMAFFVYPESADVDYRAAIAEIIWRFNTSGAKPFGNVSATVIAEDGFEKTVYWSWVDAEPVNISLALTLATGVSGPAIKAEVEAAIDEYFEGLTVGEPVSRLDIFGLLADFKPRVTAAILFINGSSTQDAEITLTQRAIPGTISITT